MTRQAVFVVIRNDNNEILLQQRANTGYLDEYWDLPSGHVEYGESLSESAVREVEEEIGFNKAKLMQIRSSVVFSQHKNGLSFGNNWTETMRELQRAHTNSHESLRRIENLRRKMKMEREFRHKSGQILFQMRIQAWILAGLYLALLVHVLFRDGSQLHLRWIVLSFVMFIIGLLWTLNMGRRIKWKI